eukprot:gene3471-biopygen15783
MHNGEFPGGVDTLVEPDVLARPRRGWFRLRVVSGEPGARPVVGARHIYCGAGKPGGAGRVGGPGRPFVLGARVPTLLPAGPAASVPGRAGPSRPLSGAPLGTPGICAPGICA